MVKYLKSLVAKANQATNSEEAKKIKKKLLKIGIILSVIGLLLVIGATIVMFVGFGSSANVDMQNPQINMSGILVPAAFGSVMFIIGGILLVIGVIAINLSLSIVIAGVTSSWLDVKNEEEKSVNQSNPNYDVCPHCKAQIAKNSKFCSNCGKSTVQTIICPHCNAKNPIENKYCLNCGQRFK